MQAQAQRLPSSGHKSMTLFSVTFIFRNYNPVTANKAMSHQYTSCILYLSPPNLCTRFTLPSLLHVHVILSASVLLHEHQACCINLILPRREAGGPLFEHHSANTVHCVVSKRFLHQSQLKLGGRVAVTIRIKSSCTSFVVCEMTIFPMQNKIYLSFFVKKWQL